MASFVSTADASRVVSFRETLLTPIPSPGALWVPKHVDPVEFKQGPLWLCVAQVLRAVTGTNLDACCKRALADFPVHLDWLESDLLVLDLSRGPTLSFKDVGCRVAAGLHRQLEIRQPVVVATSGDTGGAAAAAGFEDVCVLYPEGKVSKFQERQFHDSAAGATKHRAVALAVSADFDACQRIAKDALAAMPTSGLVSCNSVSLARLLPQAGYYVWAAQQLRKVSGGRKPTFVVPSGNFGNAAACLLALRLGAPIAGVHLACNENGRRFVGCLKRGDFRCYVAGPTVQTPATAMDVGSPSNLPRLLRWIGDDWHLASASVTTSDRIRELQSAQVCPHTACALDAARHLQKAGLHPVVVRTADAVKFQPLPNAAAAFSRAPLMLRNPKFLRCRTRVRSLLLVGMPGTGKSTLARLAGGVDGDAEMCQNHGATALAEVVKKYKTPGAFFRYEGRTLMSLLGQPDDHVHIVASGGSALHSAELRQYLKTCEPSVLVVHLTRADSTTPATVASWARRGVVVPEELAHKSPQEIAAFRAAQYEAFAHVEIRTDCGWTPKRTADALLRLVSFHLARLRSALPI